MRNYLISLCIALVAMSGSAHALTPYGGFIDLGRQDGKISNATKFGNLNLTFYGMTDPFVAEGSSVPTLLLTVPQGAQKFVDVMSILVGSRYVQLTDINWDNTSFAFTGKSLALLNEAIVNNSVTFNIAHGNSGRSTVSSAALTGTMAPEPASIALVAAGLTAIPFARRMRKFFSKEA